MVALAFACAEEPLDVRFHTPKTTIETLLDTYGVLDVSQVEIDRRLSIGRNFHLNDPATMHRCFSDWSGPDDEVLVGYIFGSLIRSKDDLSIVVTGDEATVIGRSGTGNAGRPVMMERIGSRWLISLRRSVPSRAQTELREEAAKNRRGEPRTSTP